MSDRQIDGILTATDRYLLVSAGWPTPTDSSRLEFDQFKDRGMVQALPTLPALAVRQTSASKVGAGQRLQGLAKIAKPGSGCCWRALCTASSTSDRAGSRFV
jgi:hypothetical protein